MLANNFNDIKLSSVNPQARESGGSAVVTDLAKSLRAAAADLAVLHETIGNAMLRSFLRGDAPRTSCTAPAKRRGPGLNFKKELVQLKKSKP